MEKRKKAVIYARCSTEEQHQKGNSIEYQFAQIESHPYCQTFELVSRYKDVISGTKFDRKGLNEIFNLCKSIPGYCDFILIEKWDRFGRNTELHFATVRQFKDLGVEVNAVYQVIDFTQSIWPTLLGFYATTAHSESIGISQRTKNGIAQALREGQYTASAPVGYVRVPSSKKMASGKSRNVLAVDPIKGKYIKEIFEKFISGVERDQLRAEYQEKLGVSRSLFYRIFTCVVYAGYIDCPKHNFLPAERVKGLHQGIISLDVFNETQAIINSQKVRRNKEYYSSQETANKFYLKGLLQGSTGVTMTASKSKGNGGHYEYYHTCTKPRENIAVGLAHSLVKTALKEVSMNMEVVLEAIEEEMSIQLNQAKEERKVLQSMIKRIESKIHKIEDDYFNDRLTAKSYQQMADKLRSEKREVVLKLEDVHEQMEFFSEYTKEKFEPLLNVYEIYCRSGPLKKKEILKAVFFEGFWIDKQKRQVRTNYLNSIFTVNAINSTVLKIEQKRPEDKKTSSLILGGRLDKSSTNNFFNELEFLTKSVA